MPDLSLADQHPSEAFLEGDPRQKHFIDRPTLERLIFLFKRLSIVQVRRVTWQNITSESNLINWRGEKGLRMKYS